jgi:hypothetical protein
LCIRFEARATLAYSSATHKRYLKLCEIFLLGHHPHLNRLTLEYVTTVDDRLLTFLKRHKTSLKALTLNCLSIKVDTHDCSHHDSLVVLLRFLLVLAEELSLKRLQLRDRLLVGRTMQSSDWRPPRPDLLVYCRSSMSGGLKSRVENYICYESSLPFQNLDPISKSIRQGDAISDGLTISARTDGGHMQHGEVETDDSWKIFRPGHPEWNRRLNDRTVVHV